MSDLIPLHWIGGREPEPLKPGLFAMFRMAPALSLAYQQTSEQLSKRPKPDPATWGDSPLRKRVGQVISKVLKERYDWPNDHFIPEDPYHIALLMPWDTGDIGEVAIELEDALNIETCDEDFDALIDGTLGDLADYLVEKLTKK